MTEKIAKPVIRQIKDNEAALVEFEEELRSHCASKEQELMLDYPTVYIHNWKRAGAYEVYIGETNSIIRRTKEHLARREKWQQLAKDRANLLIIGHEHFNTSLTRDVENRLMHYMMSMENVRKIHNMRGNPQNKYYPEQEFEQIFREIWKKLRMINSTLFLEESAIRDSALFKASPLHKLTADQENAKALIIRKVTEALKGTKQKQFIFIEGEAGTGKTVLNSSAFYELYNRAEELGLEKLRCCLMVNHKEQEKVYEQIAKKLGLTEQFGKVVYNPTTFINQHDPEHPIDVAFVDEAHLLLTHGRMSYKGKGQLHDIMERARITVIMFDENQILTTDQFWEAALLDHYKQMAKAQGNYLELKNQLRMSAGQQTIAWIDAFTKQRTLMKIPEDPTGYEIRVYNEPVELELAICERSRQRESALSRMVATYDWEYNAQKCPENRVTKYWEVMIKRWHRPWNYQLQKDMDRKERKSIKELAWAEQPKTIGEIGSTYTIQGFDLNYVGVILGPSVKYRGGKIIFDPKASWNKHAIQNRTLSDGTKQKFGETLIQHEVRVLMTRGINGLYIYAYDDELRKALQAAAIK